MPARPDPMLILLGAQTMVLTTEQSITLPLPLLLAFYSSFHHGCLILTGFLFGPTPSQYVCESFMLPCLFPIPCLVLYTRNNVRSPPRTFDEMPHPFPSITDPKPTNQTNSPSLASVSPDLPCTVYYVHESINRIVNFLCTKLRSLPALLSRIRLSALPSCRPVMPVITLILFLTMLQPKKKSALPFEI